MIPEPTTIRCHDTTDRNDWPTINALVVRPDPDSRRCIKVSIDFLTVSVPADQLIAAINKARGDQ